MSDGDGDVLWDWGTEQILRQVEEEYAAKHAAREPAATTRPPPTNGQAAKFPSPIKTRVGIGSGQYTNVPRVGQDARAAPSQQFGGGGAISPGIGPPVQGQQAPRIQNQFDHPIPSHPVPPYPSAPINRPPSYWPPFPAGVHGQQGRANQPSQRHMSIPGSHTSTQGRPNVRAYTPGSGAWQGGANPVGRIEGALPGAGVRLGRGGEGWDGMGQQRISSPSGVTGRPPAGTLPGSGVRQALLPARPVSLPSVRSKTPPGTTSLPPVAPLVPLTLHAPRAPILPPVNPSSHSAGPSPHQQAVAPLNPSASSGAPGVSASEVKVLREEMRRMKESLAEKEGAVSILQRRLHQADHDLSKVRSGGLQGVPFQQVQQQTASLQRDVERLTSLLAFKEGEALEARRLSGEREKSLKTATSAISDLKGQVEALKQNRPEGAGGANGDSSTPTNPPDPFAPPFPHHWGNRGGAAVGSPARGRPRGGGGVVAGGGERTREEGGGGGGGGRGGGNLFHCLTGKRGR